MGQEVVLAQHGSSNYVNGYRNRLINGSFDLWQRGTSFSNLSTYGPDRWKATYNDCGGNYTQQTGDLAGFNYQLRMIKGSAPNGSFMVQQAIETQNTPDMIGQWVTFSCYARLSNATTQAAHNFQLAIGFSATTDYSGWVNSSDICSYYARWTSAGLSGGAATFQAGSTTSSPSTPIVSSGTLSSSWTRYTITLLVPTNTKTIVCGMYSEQTVQNGGIELVGAQLELGTVAGPFERRHIQQELAMAQRYYQIPLLNNEVDVYRHSGTSANVPIQFKVTMRATPTFSFTLNSSVYASAGSINTGAGQSGLDPSSASAEGFALYVYTTSIPAQVGANVTVRCAAEI
jgi:hypothetical protein